MDSSAFYFCFAWKTINSFGVSVASAHERNIWLAAIYVFCMQQKQSRNNNWKFHLNILNAIIIWQYRRVQQTICCCFFFTFLILISVSHIFESLSLLFYRHSTAKFVESYSIVLFSVHSAPNPVLCRLICAFPSDVSLLSSRITKSVHKIIFFFFVSLHAFLVLLRLKNRYQCIHFLVTFRSFRSLFFFVCVCFVVGFLMINSFLFLDFSCFFVCVLFFLL